MSNSYATQSLFRKDISNFQPAASHGQNRGAQVKIHRSTRYVWALFLLLSLIAALPAIAGPICSQGSGPGASLLFPYIEVDLEAADGATTLISISNTSPSSQLANVVLWSNCSRPVLSFTLFLEAKQVQPLNLNQILLTGQIPSTDRVDTAAFPGCPSSLPTLDLGESDLAALSARLRGAADPNDGLCYAEPGGGSKALGFVTVDVLNDCSPTIRTPIEDGYFAPGGTGLASNANVLAGDLFLVDSANDFAQGFQAVSLYADSNLFAASPSSSFYKRGDDRQPLSSQYQARFLNGGGFDGGTDLLVWVHDLDPEGNEPSAPPCNCETFGTIPTLSAFVKNEGGEDIQSSFSVQETTPARIRVGSEQLPTQVDFGVLDLRFNDTCAGEACPTVIIERQGLVMPIYSAEGRFSAGLKAFSLRDPCQGLP